MQFHWRLITHKSLKFWIVWSYNLNCEQETNLKYCNYGVTARGTISHSNNRWANINRRDLASSICIEFWMKLKLYYMGKWRGKKKKKKTSTHTEHQKHQLQGDIEANYIHMFIKNKKIIPMMWAPTAAATMAWVWWNAAAWGCKGFELRPTCRRSKCCSVAHSIDPLGFQPLIFCFNWKIKRRNHIISNYECNQ